MARCNMGVPPLCRTSTRTAKRVWQNNEPPTYKKFETGTANFSSASQRNVVAAIMLVFVVVGAVFGRCRRHCVALIVNIIFPSREVNLLSRKWRGFLTTERGLLSPTAISRRCDTSDTETMLKPERKLLNRVLQDEPDEFSTQRPKQHKQHHD